MAFTGTILLVAFAYIMGQWPLFIVAEQHIRRSGISGKEVSSFWSTMDFSMIGMSSNLAFGLQVIIFVVAMAGLYVGMKYFHRRSIVTIITGGKSIRWSKIFWAFGIWMGLTILGECIFYLIDPGNYSLQFNTRDFMILLLLVVVFIPIQASWEEMFVRGYLMQMFGLAFRSPWIALIITACIFGSMHLMNPEVRAFGLWIMMFYYISVGLFFGLLVILDDGLELAMGIHIATNVYASLFVSYEGSVLQTPAIFIMAKADVVAMTIVFFVSAGIFFALSYRKYGWGDWIRLTKPVVEEINCEV